MRETGYYWIHLTDDDETGDWEVAYYQGGDPDDDNTGWYSIWSGGIYKDSEVKEINEQKLKL